MFEVEKALIKKSKKIKAIKKEKRKNHSIFSKLGDQSNHCFATQQQILKIFVLSWFFHFRMSCDKKKEENDS
jgi:hypothetical protein